MENSPQNKKFKEIILKIVSEINPYINPSETLNLFDEHIRFLLSENKKYNLTGFNDIILCYERHILDSIVAVQKTKSFFYNSSLILEVGTGAGFPGIPIAILFPEKKISLIESSRKKTEFLNNLIEKLKLKNVEICWGRAETFAHYEDYREKFDLVISRALSPFPILNELTIPFLKTGGFSIAFKGPDYKKEIDKSDKSFKELFSEIVEIIPYSPFENANLFLLIIKKYKSTPEKYPRKPGLPSKKPLL